MSANDKYVAERAASLCANSAPTMRQRAESVFLKNTAQSRENLDALSPEATRQMLHELQVHQIELEMQNEELRRSQNELDAAPVGRIVLTDIDERKRNEQELIESKEQIQRHPAGHERRVGKIAVAIGACLKLFREKGYTIPA